MLRKLLLSAVAAAGLMFVGTPAADAGWRRAYRQGYYNGGYAYRVPRRAYRNQVYYNNVAPYNYGYSSPGYYNGGYYAQPYYDGGVGVGVTTPGFGFYVR